MNLFINTLVETVAMIFGFCPKTGTVKFCFSFGFAYVWPSCVSGLFSANCNVMFSILTLENSPYFAPICSSLYGSMVWRWTFTIFSSITITNESPIAFNSFLKFAWLNWYLSLWFKVTLLPSNIMNSQQ
ncbi:hypothetical protein MGM1_5200 [Candidatus Malacoplasma girerdii]|uniref:Uncharacterized protein n=1 Tax=Candidatus Malacoplasma girerdii TaxID=1318617 RepID=A0A097STG5_9BACT|nr:hypothetical protein MGM1_5200 [Candidatus Malacoplasma girerdii]